MKMQPHTVAMLLAVVLGLASQAQAGGVRGKSIAQ